MFGGEKKNVKINKTKKKEKAILVHAIFLS